LVRDSVRPREKVLGEWQIADENYILVKSTHEEGVQKMTGVPSG